jgi:hypothetical protein
MRRSIGNARRTEGRSSSTFRQPSSRLGLFAPIIDRQSAYYLELWKRAKAFRVSFKADGWWDLWHMHFDSNPNADNFPHSFDSSVELNHVPALLNGLVDLERYAVRRDQFEGSTWYVIVPRCL